MNSDKDENHEMKLLKRAVNFCVKVDLLEDKQYETVGIFKVDDEIEI